MIKGEEIIKYTALVSRLKIQSSVLELLIIIIMCVTGTKNRLCIGLQRDEKWCIWNIIECTLYNDTRKKGVESCWCFMVQCETLQLSINLWIKTSA